MSLIYNNSFLENQNSVNVSLPKPVVADSTKNKLNYKNLIKESPDSLAERIKSAEETGAFIYILNSDYSIDSITNKFYLTGMQISFKERVQLLDTFEGENITFFGDSVKIYGFSGVSIDYFSTNINKNYLHQSFLMNYYNNKLRGTLLVKNKQVAVLKVLNHLIYGYPLDFSVGYDANFDKAAQFRTSWVILKHITDFPVYNFNYNVNDFIFTYTDSPIIKKIDEILNNIDNFINLENWSNEIKDKFDYLFKSSFLIDLTPVDFDNLYNFSNGLMSKFQEELNKKLKNFKTYLEDFIKSEENINVVIKNNISNFLNQLLNYNNNFYLNGRIDYNNFNAYLQYVILLREQLLILKVKYL